MGGDNYLASGMMQKIEGRKGEGLHTRVNDRRRRGKLQSLK